MKSVIFCGAFLSCFMLKTTYAQITAWTEPDIMSNKDGSATAGQTVKEDGTGTFPTLAASGSGTLTYTITMQTPAGVFQFDAGTAGLLELAAGQSLDYEANQEHVLVVEVVDADDTGNPSGTGTATVTITIDDLNDNAPVVQPARTILCLAHGTASGTVVTLSAIDADGTATNNVISPMTIARGNTDSDFAINAGVITVNNALDKTRTLGYLLEVDAEDSGAPTGTGTATVVVTVEDSCGCSGTVMLAASIGVTLLFGLVTSLV